MGVTSAFGIIGLGLGGFAILIIVFNILKGLIVGFKKVLKSLAVIVLALVIAAIATAILCNPDSGLVSAGMDGIGDMLGSDMGEIFAVEELEVTLKYYAAMMVGPFLFIVIFMIVWPILSIIVAILFKVIPPLHSFIKDKPSALLHRGGGAALGLVCGWLIAVILLMPLVGTLSFVTSMPYDMLMEDSYQPEYHPTREEAEMNKWQDAEGNYHISDWYDEEGNRHVDCGYDQFGNYYENYVEYNYDHKSDEQLEEEKEEMMEMMEEANETIDLFMNCGCGPLYNAFASAKFEGERVYLKDDVHTLMELINTISNVETSDDDKLSHSHTEMLRDVIGYVDRSALLRNTVAGIFATASESWQNGEEFLGIDKIEGGDLMGPVVDELLKTLSTTTSKTVTSDINAMIGSFEVMIDSGILEDMTYSTMLKELGKENGVLDQMVAVLNQNKRMNNVAAEVSQLSTRALASHLNSQGYGTLMTDLAQSLNANSGMSGDEKREAIRNQMDAAFRKNQIDIQGKALDDVVDGFIAEFEGESYVTDTQITNYFASRVIVENADNNGDFNYNGF